MNNQHEQQLYLTHKNKSSSESIHVETHSVLTESPRHFFYLGETTNWLFDQSPGHDISFPGKTNKQATKGHSQS